MPVNAGRIIPAPGNALALSGSGGTSDGWRSALLANELNSATAITSVIALTTDGSGIAVGRWGAAAYYGGWLVAPNANGMAFLASSGPGSANWYAPYTVPLNDGKFHVIVYRWIAPNTGTIWLDGALSAPAGLWFNGSAANIQSGVSEYLWFNRHADSGTGSPGAGTRVAWYGHTTQALSDSECLSLSQNPWQLAQAARRAPITGASIAMPTLGPVRYTPGTLTSTGFGIRVDAT